MPACLIALGSNLRPRAQSLQGALAKLEAHEEVFVTAVSRFHRSKSIGGPEGQPSFLNGALVLETPLAPERLLDLLQETENSLGRVRGERWGARRIDLDLLLYDALVLETPRLVIPHPRMVFRRFVLEPAAEIASAMLHPTSGLTVGQLLENLNTAANYVAITGPSGAGQTRLARRLAEHFQGRFLADPAAAGRIGDQPLGSRSLSVEIESMSQRAEQLNRLNLGGLSGMQESIAVSDYWIQPYLKTNLAGLSREESGDLGSLWTALRSQAPSPKLILALMAPADFLYARCCAEDEQFAVHWSAEAFGRRHSEYTEQIKSLGRGPIFHLDAVDDDLVWTEAVAAVEAMR